MGWGSVEEVGEVSCQGLHGCSISNDRWDILTRGHVIFQCMQFIFSRDVGFFYIVPASCLFDRAGMQAHRSIRL